MNRDNALVGVAVLIGSQVPLTIEKIPNPTVKALVQILALLVVLFAAMKVDTKKLQSIPPPAPKKEG